MFRGISNREVGISEYSELHGLIGTANCCFFHLQILCQLHALGFHMAAGVMVFSKIYMVLKVKVNLQLHKHVLLLFLILLW